MPELWDTCAWLKSPYGKWVSVEHMLNYTPKRLRLSLCVLRPPCHSYINAQTGRRPSSLCNEQRHGHTCGGSKVIVKPHLD
eukprot:1644695-Amphidinium_carterae.1